MSNKKLISIIALVVFGGFVIYLLLPVLSPFFVGAFLAFILFPVKRFFIKKCKMKNWLATLTVVLSVLILLILFVYAMGAPVMKELNTLVNNLANANYKEIATNFRDMLANANAPKFIVEQVDSLVNASATENVFQYGIEFLYEKLGTVVSAIGSSLFAYVMKSIDILVNVFLTLILTIYFLASGDNMIESIINICPTEKTKIRVRGIIEEISVLFKNYLRVQVIVATIVSSILGICYAIFGVKYALLLVCIAFVLSFVPFFGAIVSGAIATLIALVTSGFHLAIIVLVITIVIQQLDGNILTPKLQSHSSETNPVVVLLAILGCNYVFGFIGMFIAVPMIGIVKLVFKHGTEIIKEMD